MLWLGIWPPYPGWLDTTVYGCQCGMHVGSGHVQSDTSKLKATPCFCSSDLSMKQFRRGKPGMGCSKINPSLLAVVSRCPFLPLPPFCGIIFFFTPHSFLLLDAVLVNKAQLGFHFSFFSNFLPFFLAWLPTLTFGLSSKPKSFSSSLFTYRLHSLCL